MFKLLISTNLFKLIAIKKTKYPNLLSVTNEDIVLADGKPIDSLRRLTTIMLMRKYGTVQQAQRRLQANIERHD